MRMTEYAWLPTSTYVEHANVTRLMRSHRIDSLGELRRRATEDIAWFWDAVVTDLGIDFSVPYEEVVDTTAGAPWATWFVGGQLNLATTCLERWARSESVRHWPALIGESEEGVVREFSFAELDVEVDELAAALAACGVVRGDRVAAYMPMVAEATIALYAIAKLGAVYVPIFSGFAASAVAARLRDSGAKVLITADGTHRRGEPVAMKQAADAAAAEAPSVERLIVLEHAGLDMPMTAGRDITWAEATRDHEGERVDALQLESEAPFMLAYTSGTTGAPKGTVHVHGGFLVKIASECAYQLDLHPRDVFHWVTDMGWVMGPLALIGAHSNCATLVISEGAPDYPEPDRLWATVERHRMRVLGISPTLIRALRTRGEEWPARHDLTSLQILGSTGEPWNPEPYRWLMGVTDGRVPIINISGGTEVGACFLSPHPVEPIKECGLGGPALGMDVDVFDPQGRPVRRAVGELVCKQPWPAMTRGIWGDPDRYLETYWSTYPGVWRHGDWARIDADGHWFLLGRSDETINVAGKRLGPAEVESALASHPKVVESAAVGIPHELKGEAIWCFVVAVEAEDDLPDELAEHVAARLSRAFRPARVVLVEALPKTRSAKTIRRAIRAVALGEDPGDLSGAENPEALDAIRRGLGAQAQLADSPQSAT
jgi:acetyl-CoA synthetase